MTKDAIMNRTMKDIIIEKDKEIAELKDYIKNDRNYKSLTGEVIGLRIENEKLKEENKDIENANEKLKEEIEFQKGQPCPDCLEDRQDLFLFKQKVKDEIEKLDIEGYIDSLMLKQRLGL